MVLSSGNVGEILEEVGWSGDIPFDSIVKQVWSHTKTYEARSDVSKAIPRKSPPENGRDTRQD